MKAPLILVTCRQMQAELPRHRERIEKLGYEVLAPDLGARQQFTSADLLEYSDRLVGIIAGDDQLDRPFFACATKLKTVIRWGVGTDSVDHDAARVHRVTVRNTPGVFGHEVAESVFGYILNLVRGYITVDSAVRRGEWPKVEGVTLAGARLGVVGLGSVGREVAKLGESFGMDVVASDPFAVGSQTNVSVVGLHELLRVSRFIVLACPLTAQTLHLINAERLALARSDAYLVNVARGRVVVEKDLVDALKSGRLAGAALDVFEIEPLPLDSELRSLPNVVLGAHNGSNTREGIVRASNAAVEFLIEELTR